jgi:uncharacterized membrane protein
MQKPESSVRYLVFFGINSFFEWLREGTFCGSITRIKIVSSNDENLSFIPEVIS